MSALSDIYDFENVFETALKAVLEANQIKAYTSQDFNAAATADFQLQRPRVEIVFVTGAGQEQWTLVNGQPRQTSWKGSYLLRIVTEPLAAVHGAFRSNVRGLMHGMGIPINGTDPMTRHKIQPWFREAGTTIAVKTEDGYFMSNMNFDIDFSVQVDAWATLTT